MTDMIITIAARLEKRHPEFNGRVQRAIEIVQNGDILEITKDYDGHWLWFVESPTGNGSYIVDLVARTCQCKDHQHGAPIINGSPCCKHRLAVLITLALRGDFASLPPTPAPASLKRATALLASIPDRDTALPASIPNRRSRLFKDEEEDDRPQYLRDPQADICDEHA